MLEMRKQTDKSPADEQYRDDVYYATYSWGFVYVRSVRGLLGIRRALALAKAITRKNEIDSEHARSYGYAGETDKEKDRCYCGDTSSRNCPVHGNV